ncbi:hypothetical protein GGI15_002905 [Coemansia interrupta]|uniref:Large ribosomal subunit protein uL30m n=1 Tax=Coemansia interrupta TaxID=1126814 RepID=A0A9W8HH96_9FUNG|nr:hypothetical protein GGI15_002905 [Coemansia interrupta]
MFRCIAQRSTTAATSQTHFGVRLLSGTVQTTPAANAEGKFWKITLQRSTIGLPPRTRENARALGLKRRGHVAYRAISNEIAGQIVKLKEVVKVELVDKVEPLHVKAANGYEVIGRMNPQVAPGSTAAKPLLPLRKRKE